MSDSTTATLPFDTETSASATPSTDVFLKPTFSTTSPEDVDIDWSSDHEILWTILHCIIAVVGMTGNTLVLIVIMRIKDKSQNNNINLLILNQSVIDLFTSVILFAANISDYLDGMTRIPAGALGRIVCGVWYSRFVLFSLFAASTFNIMMMAIERYFAVVKPHSYTMNFNKRNTFVPIITVWIMAPLMQIYPAVSQWGIEGGTCSWVPPASFAAGVATGVLVFLYEFFIPLITMTFMYATIVIKLRESARKVRVNVASSSNSQDLTRNSTLQTKMSTINVRASNVRASNANSFSQGAPSSLNSGHWSPVRAFSITNTSSVASQNNLVHFNRARTSQAQERIADNPVGNAKKVSRNITFTILMVVLMFAILWTPNQVTFLVINFGVYVPFDSIGYQFTVILAFCNQCINPVLYGLKYKPFQSELRKMFRR